MIKQLTVIILKKLLFIIFMTIIVMAVSCSAGAESVPGISHPEASSPKAGTTPVPAISPGSQENHGINTDQRISSLNPENRTVSGGQTGSPAGSGTLSIPFSSYQAGTRSPFVPPTDKQSSDSLRQKQVDPVITPGLQSPTGSQPMTGVLPVGVGKGSSQAGETYKNLHYGPDSGALLLSSSPTGASVYVDDNYKGKTPSTGSLEILDLDTGTHTILLSCTGYGDYTIDITISRNKVETLHLILTPEVEIQTPSVSGTLEIMSDPLGADLFLDNEYKGITPLTQHAVSTGAHTILVKKDGYSEYTGTISIISDQKTAISAILTPVSAVADPTISPNPAASPVPKATEAGISFWIPGAGLFIAALCLAEKRR